MATAKRMKLAAYFNPTGHHVASWRHPRAQIDAHVNIAHYAEIAQTAERAKFDLLFLADSDGVRDAHMDALCRSVQFIAGFEPFTLLSSLAMVTEKIGLVCTASTSWNEPYRLARNFASLDIISGGRAAWNVVTSNNDRAAQNFSLAKAYEHGDRYDRAAEVVEIVKGLWDSWDDDAFVRDAQSGLYFDPGKLHELNHKSDRYQVRGPLNVPRSPQGQPVLVQAGASEAGRNLAASIGEVVFSPHLTIEAAKEYYDDVRARAADFGRNPDHIAILPGLSAIVRPTEQEADEDFEFLQSLIHPIVGREIVASMLKADLTGCDLDEELPDLDSAGAGSVGHFESIMKMARDERLTLRELGQRVAGARGKNTIKGTPTQVADYMEEWVSAGACDGFTVMPPYIPGALDDFCEMVIPELQRRGVFRTDYEGSTLRDHLGIPKPKSRYAAA